MARIMTLVIVILIQSAGLRLEGQGVIEKDTSGQSVQLGAARLSIDINGPVPDLSRAALQHHIFEAARAVTLYYGHFPVTSAHIVISIAPGGKGVLEGTTWGNRDGFPAVTKLRIGQHTTRPELDTDWIATHELVHMALASLPDSQQWLEEGIATYVEPVARVQAGQLTEQRIWGDMVAGMVHGEPGAGDRGLDRTHTWGRTYWGGALFCLVADVEIRQQSGNKRGLQDALRGIVNAGGTIDKDWTVERVLRAGDEATGTTVLSDLYVEWGKAPVKVDLESMWAQLGVRVADGEVTFDDNASLAAVRTAITKPSHP
jgi:hypothetical protein